ncbi:TRAP transporter small permease [Pararhodobacter oceanensis]|uniref:TRAP transporter small permease n=1 Tax=Pararhodobacter oceanensis TaxID=2172121 RepID=UPI003A94F539
MFNKLNATIHGISKTMAILTGWAFLLLAIFMTFEAVSRKLGGPITGVSDSFASLVMVFGATWSLSYALAADNHVRIDVLTGVYSDGMKRLTLILALLTTSIYAAVLAWQAWNLAFASHARGAYLPGSLLEIQLVWPQAVGALGYSIMVLQGAVIIAAEFVKFREQRA